VFVQPALATNITTSLKSFSETFSQTQPLIEQVAYLQKAILSFPNNTYSFQ
jgi:hypothetical protein